MGALCAGLCCLGGWAVIGGAAGWLAHRRMRSVEASAGHRAEPPHEGRWLWYAGAVTVWLAAAVLAVVGLLKRDRVRVGRDCTFILLGHFTLVTVGSVVTTMIGDPGDMDPLPIVVLACLVAGGGLTVAPVLAAVWAMRRAKRIAAQPPTGDPPGAERFLLYGASLLLWPVGLVMAFVYAKPENVRVGAIALCMSLAQLWLIAVGTCVGLPLLVAAYWPG